MTKNELTRQPLFLSTVLHLCLVLALLFVFRGKDQFYDEIPVEITEFIRKLGEPSSTGPKLEKKSAEKPPEKTESGIADAPSNPVASTSTGGSPDGDPLAEDYEVSEMPLLLNEVRVPYPAEARTRGVQGNVVFDLKISSDGKVREWSVISSPDPVLTNAAEKAVALFKFRPARMGDKSVAIRIRYTYRFLLQ